MDQLQDALELLNKLPQPAFCVKDGIIVKINQAAACYLIEAGTEIRTLLETGAEEYAEFKDGCLYLSLRIAGISLGASVIKIREYDIFCVEQDADNRELQAMALASRELSKPLGDVMIITQQLFPLSWHSSDPMLSEQMTRLNRGLFQMLRVVRNMADANRYAAAAAASMEILDISGFIREMLDKASTLVEHTGITMEYADFPERLHAPVDREKLERAVYNIISNAVKFTPAGGTIRVSLTRRGNKLYLSVLDSGSGIAAELRGSIFSRFARIPGLEGDQFGIGLGMVLIRSAAALHGGTVLVDHPEGSGTRITMSLSLRTDSTQLRTPRQNIDYSGGWDRGLMELSHSLPPELYSLK